MSPKREPEKKAVPGEETDEEEAARVRRSLQLRFTIGLRHDRAGVVLHEREMVAECPRLRSRANEARATAENRAQHSATIRPSVEP